MLPREALVPHSPSLGTSNCLQIDGGLDFSLLRFEEINGNKDYDNREN